MEKFYHFKDKNGNNLNDNEVFVHEDGKCYVLMGSGRTSKRKYTEGPTMFVNADAKIVWKLSTEMTPFSL
ncbi:hypothetical protein PP940_gp026 [Rhizobium phage RL2RES]|uniref:Uncharacterized protein n=1 Tax=Rhizobium phage RL2RES TaxID=103371 RepID=A0A6B9J4F5_9CAUD|nr:hypothetical protein PP940_gp026 [Rhizobium phage RL2RES]QGZ14328.1 hypothetical protein RL2RES_026 [Rhizobium phage RL2RES]